MDRIKVEVIHITPLHISDIAISKCWDTKTKLGKALKERMYRIACKHKHGSTIEHLVVSFEITGVSRALLQELARHRIQSLSVKSTRYTLKELRHRAKPFDYRIDPDGVAEYCVMTGSYDTNVAIGKALEELHVLVNELNLPNDVVKYALPEAYRTDLVSTFNFRSLQNFLSLRSDKSALPEIQYLAKKMFEAIPEDYLFLLYDYLKSKKEGSERGI